jgi:hypothetical protein
MAGVFFFRGVLRRRQVWAVKILGVFSKAPSSGEDARFFACLSANGFAIQNVKRRGRGDRGGETEMAVSGLGDGRGDTKEEAESVLIHASDQNDLGRIDVSPLELERVT